MAYLLGLTVQELQELPYDEVLGWRDFFSRRPPGWREDNRAAIIAMSFGGSKLKPEKLFHSLKVIKSEQVQSSGSYGEKFFDRFAHLFTEKVHIDEVDYDFNETPV